MVKAVCHSKERVGGVSSSTLKSAQGGGIDLYQLSWDSRNLLVVLQEAISPTHLSLLKKLLIAGAIVRHIVLLVFLGVALTVQLPSGSVAVPSRQPTPLEKNVCLLHAHYFSDCM